MAGLSFLRCIGVALPPTLLLIAFADRPIDNFTIVLVALLTTAASWLWLKKPAELRIRTLRSGHRQADENHADATVALQRERDVLGGILETMQEGVLLLDETGRIALINRSLRATLLLPATVIGSTPLEVLRYAELQELIQKARATKSALAGELEISGLKPRRLAVLANPMETPPDYMLVVFFDVTDIRRLEKLRSEFVTNVSHELRTPVTAVCSASETLIGGALNDPKTARTFLDIIQRNSERMRLLVEDLLDLSRLESREYKLDNQPVDLARAVERTMALLADKARTGRVRMDIEVAEDLPRVSADERALDQVLSNLLENSIKYCPPGSRIVVKAQVEENIVRVRVEDTGPGIDAQYLPRLFERFYRVDLGRSRDIGGTGLGLSIVKHLVEAMGGSVGVSSRVGIGSTFWFTLSKVPGLNTALN